MVRVGGLEMYSWGTSAPGWGPVLERVKVREVGVMERLV